MRTRFLGKFSSKRNWGTSSVIFCILLGDPRLSCAFARQSSFEAETDLHNGTEHDGLHDFDFEIGTWKSHASRLLHPLTGSATWTRYEGISVVRKVWNGRANLVELEADGPAGHLEVLSLRLYNPHSYQWSLHYAHSSDGRLEAPLFGKFDDGRGEFYGQDRTSDGKVIYVRHVWSDITRSSCHFEQAFSPDGGKTWEPNFIEVFTRIDDGALSQQMVTRPDRSRDFDFEIGRWNVQLSRLVKPLTGSHIWVSYRGTSVVRPVWSGRANLVELEVDGSAGHLEGLSLRLYNPHSRQWNISWADSAEGTLGQPMMGGFKAGRGEFFDQELHDGQAILVRFVFSNITANSCHFEQSFSADGGKTWEVNFIEDYTRVQNQAANTQ